MKVLVTGATGFIGNYVVRELLQRGHTVIATSRNENKAMQTDWISEVTYITGNIHSLIEREDLFAYFQQPDCLIHLAWEGLPNYKSEHHLTENLPAHKLFVAKLIAGGLKNINIIGTCFEYGIVNGELHEEMEAKPENAYAKAKNELRIFAENLQQEHNFSLKWLRLFYMYGKGQAANSLIPQLDTALSRGDESFNMSGGEQIRDFLPVEKVAAYIVDTSVQNQTTGIINICSNQPITVKDFVLEYLNKKNTSIHLNLGFYPYADFEPMRFWGNNQKLKSISNE